MAIKEAEFFGSGVLPVYQLDVDTKSLAEHFAPRTVVEVRYSGWLPKATTVHYWQAQVDDATVLHTSSFDH
jgi:hypothetical protein